MNHCFDLIRKILLSEEQHVSKQENALNEFQDDLETIEKSIQNFTMNYQQTMSMIESKHMINQENLAKELENQRLEFVEQRYQIQGFNHQRKNDHESKIYFEQQRINDDIAKKANELYDQSIFALMIEKNKLYQHYEEKVQQLKQEKASIMNQTKADIELLETKKNKDLSTIIILTERVDPVDVKNPTGTSLEEAKTKRRDYHQAKTNEIDHIFNINKHYAEKKIEKESIVSKAEIELKLLPEIWLIERNIEESKIEAKIKQLENQKNDYLDQEQLRFEYFEKKEKDSILFEEDETIESLKEVKINEDYSKIINDYKKKIDRNEEIVSAGNAMHEYHIESIDSTNSFLEMMIGTTHKMLKDMMLFESKRLHMQMELMIDMINQHYIYIASMVTKTNDTLKLDFKNNIEYIDFDSKDYETKYETHKNTLIKEMIKTIQLLKSQIEDANKQMQQIMQVLLSNFDVMKDKSLQFKKIFSENMRRTKLEHQRVFQLFRRNYVYKLEEKNAMEKIIKFKLDAQPMKNKILLHQKAEKLFDSQTQAKDKEQKQVLYRTKALEKEISERSKESQKTLEKELSNKLKLMQDYLDGVDQMIERQKNVNLIRLENEKRKSISKI